MGDGSALQQSAVSGNSNFYLYNSNNSTSSPPNSGQVRFDNNQSLATIIYINHITRDSTDIEVPTTASVIIPYFRINGTSI